MSKIHFSLTPLQSVAFMDVLELMMEAIDISAAPNMGIMNSKESLQSETCISVFNQIDSQYETIEESDLDQDMADYNKQFRDRAKNN